MSTVCAGSLFSLRIFAGFSEKILTLDNEKDMDKNKICEALYALSGNVVVKRRKFQLLPAVLFVAGAAMIVVNNMYGADLTNNLRSSIVFIGGIMVVAGMIMAAAQMFGVPIEAIKKGNPEYSYRQKGKVATLARVPHEEDEVDQVDIEDDGTADEGGDLPESPEEELEPTTEE